MTVTAMIEREIAKKIAASGLRLRFDKVVLRVIGDLRASLVDIIPDNQTVIFSLTAPIKLPAKTTAAIDGLVRGGLPHGDVRDTIYGNHVRFRRVAGVPADMPRILGFVHNPESDAGLVLDLAEARLLGRDPK
jgi:hypothetical protein